MLLDKIHIGTVDPDARRFWTKAFLVYALVEVIILTMQYIVTYSQCKPCVLPPAFYPIIWILHLAFTGGTWYFLNKYYKVSKWQLVVLNLVVFFVYYFLWLGILYLLFEWRPPWLIWSTVPERDFAHFVYGSWSDIGRYVGKVSAFYVLKFYFEYRRSEKQRIQLAVLNKDMQLNLLKQQLSPHFYFNTLNNLYGLAWRQHPKLPTALGQLSTIMQYVIVEGNRSSVSLAEELHFLESYIALEKLRYEAGTQIDLCVRGQPNGQLITPLLLIQFVENAFKHGMKEKSEQNWMKVELSIQSSELDFSVENSYYQRSGQAGIGINSVKHILELQYTGRYALDIKEDRDRFSVHLKLDLS